MNVCIFGKFKQTYQKINAKENRGRIFTCNANSDYDTAISLVCLQLLFHHSKMLFNFEMINFKVNKLRCHDYKEFVITPHPTS